MMGEKNKVVYFCVHFHSCCSLNVPLVHSFAHFYPHELNKKKKRRNYMNVYYQWKMILVQVSDYTCLFYSFLVSKIKYHFVCTCFLKKKQKKNFV